MRYIIGKGTITEISQIVLNAMLRNNFATQFKKAKTQEFPQYLL